MEGSRRSSSYFGPRKAGNVHYNRRCQFCGEPYQGGKDHQKCADEHFARIDAEQAAQDQRMLDHQGDIGHVAS